MKITAKLAAAALLVAAFLPPDVSGQAAQKTYFQQEVNTKIEATLDDRAHTLTAREEIEYVNNSPDALSEIWLHLWANAYSSDKTAMAKQFRRLGELRFHFSKKAQRGGLSGLDFSVDGQRVTWEIDPANPDICKVILPKPLAPGGRIRIATPFTLKIPDSFSRLGHVDQSYQMTQWFPKPAVYDARGWHAMPYLNMGEFYSEFGQYDVSITLPENYVVGATGTLQTPAEAQFLDKKLAETKAKLAGKKNMAFPESSPTLKTIRFTAENVHDFAWFADKRFLVVADTARLASGKAVPCWGMFINDGAGEWAKSAFYVRRAVEHYSSRVGEYAWPQATAVLSALSAGGGMEYPMITVINNEKTAEATDDVIAHEVGHNWFYGMLASNERDHPWMDEGMNSYYEHEYMRRYYGSDGMDKLFPKWLFHGKKSGSLMENGFDMLARRHWDIAPDSHSDKFTGAGYGLLVYMKTSMVMRWLEKSSGTERFDAALRAYFQKWKFRHPYPEDLQASLRESGLAADWFLEQMQTTRHADFDLKKVEKLGDGSFKLTVQNRGEAAAPFSVGARAGEKIIAEKWYEPFAGKSTEITSPEAAATGFVLDPQRITLDIDRSNNYRNLTGSGRSFHTKMWAPVEEAGRTTLGIFPWVGWNKYDRTELGLLFYNPPLPGQRLQVYLAPGIGLRGGGLVGLADLKWNFYPKSGLRRLTFGLEARRHRLYDLPDTFTSAQRHFLKISPSVEAELPSHSLTFHHYLRLRAIFINERHDGPDRETAEDDHYTIFEANYHGGSKRAPNPYGYSFELESQRFDERQHYLLAKLNFGQCYFYDVGKCISVRVFGGYFLKNTAWNSGFIGFNQNGGRVRGALSLAANGSSDYRYDEVFFGRNEESGLLARQVMLDEGGFKFGFGARQREFDGHSNQYLFALNLRADLPLDVPVLRHFKPYFDLAYTGDDRLKNGPVDNARHRIWFSSGLEYDILPNVLSVYFPLFNSSNLEDLYGRVGGSYLNRVAWRLNLHGLEPSHILEKQLRR